MGYDVAVRAEATLGEGPTWDADAGRLIWLDILGSRVNTYDPSSGRQTLRTTDQHVGAAKPRAGGGLVLNLRDGVGLLDPDDTFRWLHHEAEPGRRANDAAVAPDGTLWAGTMRYDEAPGGGTLFDTLAAIDPGFAIVEFNTADLRHPDRHPSYADGYRALRDLWNADARFVSPMAFNGSNGNDAAAPTAASGRSAPASVSGVATAVTALRCSTTNRSGRA